MKGPNVHLSQHLAFISGQQQQLTEQRRKWVKPVSC